jgi:hypothetical protein
MTTLTELAANLRPIAIHDLRSELRDMRAGETLLLVVGGREFIIVAGADWRRLIEEAGDHNALPLAPP